MPGTPLKKSSNSVSYHVEFETRARKEFLELPQGIAHRLARAFDDLKENPRPPGAKKLFGADGYRIRKGDYRILYTVDDKKRLVRVCLIGHRREVYRREWLLHDKHMAKYMGEPSLVGSCQDIAED